VGRKFTLCACKCVALPTLSPNVKRRFTHSGFHFILRGFVYVNTIGLVNSIGVSMVCFRASNAIG